MAAARHNHYKAAGMVAVLLTLIAVNVADVCAAAIQAKVASAHPCCPVSSDTAPKHCAKLGCFMADPAIVASVRMRAGTATFEMQSAAFPIEAARAEGLVPVNMPRAAVTLPLRLHQLLI